MNVSFLFKYLGALSTCLGFVSVWQWPTDCRFS